MDKALVRAQALLGEARSMIDNYRDKLQNDFDEKSEKWQGSPAGEALTERISQVEDVSSEIENCESSINELETE